MAYENLKAMLAEKKNRLQMLENNVRGPSHDMAYKPIDDLVDMLPTYYRSDARLWPRTQIIDVLIKRRFPELADLRDEVKRLEKRISDLER